MHDAFHSNTSHSPAPLPGSANPANPANSDPSDHSTERAAFFRSFVYAWHGLVYAIRTQRNARVHAVIGAGAIALGLILHISPVEFAMIFVAITLVFIAEMFNTVARSEEHTSE